MVYMTASKEKQQNTEGPTSEGILLQGNHEESQQGEACPAAHAVQKGVPRHRSAGYASGEAHRRHAQVNSFVARSSRSRASRGRSRSMYLRAAGGGRRDGRTVRWSILAGGGVCARAAGDERGGVPVGAGCEQPVADRRTKR